MLTGILQALIRMCERLSQNPDGEFDPPTGGAPGSFRALIRNLLAHPEPLPILARARVLVEVGVPPEMALRNALGGLS